MKKIIIILSFITAGFGSAVHSQVPNENEVNNIIYASVGNFGLWGTVYGNYERLVAARDNTTYSRYYLHAAYGGYATWGAEGRSTKVSLKWLSGRKNSHLELGLGVASLFDRLGYNIGVSNANYPYPGYDNEPSKSDYRNIIPAATIGYRFHKPGGRFVFRTGIASPDGVYLSIGFAF